MQSKTKDKGQDSKTRVLLWSKWVEGGYVVRFPDPLVEPCELGNLATEKSQQNQVF